MLNTYLNDNQHRPYPFYGGVTLPFPMSCITGLGLCLQQVEDGAHTPIYASVVAVAADSVRVALCRDLDGTGNLAEFIGMLYADTTGAYQYIAGSEDNAVYETTLITDPVDPERLVFGEITDLPYSEEDASRVSLADMQIFYAFVRSLYRGMPRSMIHSTAYMQLGTIPKDAIGVYSGKFYLDPACVVYMSSEVYGYHEVLTANDSEMLVDHTVRLAVTGLLTAKVENGSLVFGCLDSTDNNILNSYPEHGLEFVEYLNGTTTSNLHSLHIDDFTVDTLIDGETVSTTEIAWQVQEIDSTVLLTVKGTTAFPNCYGAEDQVR